ncbi:DUF1127 domain-containing protein [Pelagibius sp. 7325]|uniref:DUF1127 domain-containing protein n=1 Tax=Pelagibius sp. 7325 TaxID=3131994 RepID=UPI0030EEB93F
MSFSDFAIFNHDFRVRRGLQAGALGVPSLAGFFLALRDHWRRQEDYRTLMDLPDNLLEDIGLDRARVAAALKQRLF